MCLIFFSTIVEETSQLPIVHSTAQRQGLPGESAMKSSINTPFYPEIAFVNNSNETHEKYATAKVNSAPIINQARLDNVIMQDAIRPDKQIQITNYK